MQTKNWIFCLILILLLLIRFHFYYSDQKVSNYVDDQKVSFSAVLAKEPKVIGAYQTFWVNDPNNEKFLIKTYKYPQYIYAQNISITGTATKQVLKNNQVIVAINFPQIKAEQNSQILPLAVISLIRQHITGVFQKTLPPISSSLLLGIVFGFKQEIPFEFNNALRTSGVTHVIAASGMNVTLVGAFFAGLFTIFFKRQIALIFTILGILFYTLLAGFEASIIRASIMGSLAFGAQILGRQTLAAYSLLITGYLMLFLSPDLISDIGFQLSFISTLGLVFIKSLFETGRLKQLVQKSIIGEDLTTTISAQIATIPILFSNFGTYSAWSVIVNGLVLWTIPVLMIFGGLAAIASFVFEPISVVFLYLSLPFLLFFEKVVIFFAGLPSLVSVNVQESGFPWQITLGYYLLLSALTLFFYRKSK